MERELDELDGIVLGASTWTWCSTGPGERPRVGKSCSSAILACGVGYRIRIVEGTVCPYRPVVNQYMEVLVLISEYSQRGKST